MHLVNMSSIQCIYTHYTVLTFAHFHRRPGLLGDVNSDRSVATLDSQPVLLQQIYCHSIKLPIAVCYGISRQVRHLICSEVTEHDLCDRKFHSSRSLSTCLFCKIIKGQGDRILAPTILSSIAILLLLLLHRGDPMLQASRDGIFVSFLSKCDRVDDTGRLFPAFLSWTSTLSQRAMPSSSPNVRAAFFSNRLISTLCNVPHSQITV